MSIIERIALFVMFVVVAVILAGLAIAIRNDAPESLLNQVVFAWFGIGAFCAAVSAVGVALWRLD